MKHVPDITGQRFGRFVVLSRNGTVPKGRGLSESGWLCRCDCGAEKTLRRSDLTSGNTMSCGCLRTEKSAARLRTHGLSGTREFRIWAGIITRCKNPKAKTYARYGGRGVAVCERWRNSFEAFLGDMGDRPSVAHSIDRIDNGRGYEPGNCRWATTEEQMNNRTNSRFIEFNGKTLTLAQWAKEVGVTRKVLAARIDVLGWSVEKALTTEVRRSHVQSG